MCQANKCIDKLMRWVLIVFMVVMSVLMIVFFLRAEIPALKVLPQETTHVECSVKVAPQVSVQLVKITQRLDSVQSVLSDIRDQYQDDINIGIDRLNSWVGFWLALLAFILMIAGIWQYLKVRQYDLEWQAMLKDWNTEKQSLQTKGATIDKRLKELQTESNQLKDKFQLENIIFNLLRTMSSIHDPLMLLKEDKRKPMVLEYLGKIQKLLQRYKDCVKDVDGADNDYCLIFLLILTNFRLAMSRSLILFTNPGANVQIRLFLEYVEKEESNIRSEKKVKKEMVDTFNSKVGELIKCLEVI